MLFAVVLVLTIGCIAFILAREGHGGPRPDGLRRRIQARGWSLLLLPVATAAAVMAGGARFGRCALDAALWTLRFCAAEAATGRSSSPRSPATA